MTSPAQVSADVAERRRAGLVGIALTIVACACFALLDTASKLVTAAVPLIMAMWPRYVIQSLLMTAFVLQREGPAGLRTTQPRFQALRGALFALMNLFGLASLMHMPLAEFTAIVATMPLWVTVVAALWLRQRVSAARWVLVLSGLAGALAIVRPGGTEVSWALLWPLAMVICGTAFQVLSSRMAGRESPATTQLYTSWVAAALTSLVVPFAWQPIHDPWIWAGLFTMGLSSAVGHLLLLHAYARTTPVTIAPFLFSQIGFAMLAGWLVFRHIPDGWSMAGIAMIVASGAASVWLTVRETGHPNRQPAQGATRA